MDRYIALNFLQQQVIYGKDYLTLKLIFFIHIHTCNSSFQGICYIFLSKLILNLLSMLFESIVVKTCHMLHNHKRGKLNDINKHKKEIQITLEK